MRTVLGADPDGHPQPARPHSAQPDQTDATYGVAADKLWSERRRNHFAGHFRINAVVREDATLDHALNDRDAHAFRFSEARGPGQQVAVYHEVAGRERRRPSLRL